MKYNPFKMWGSYVGVVVFYILSVRGFFITCTLERDMAHKFCLDALDTLIIHNQPYSIYIIPPIIGFLIGWGIHSLFRRFKR